MFRTEEEWVDEYRRRQSLYIWDGNPKHAHPILRSGNHSSGFFNSRPVIADERLLQEASSDLVQKVLARVDFLQRVDRVVGPQTGATKLAQFMAERITEMRGRPCLWASPKKSDDGETMTWEGEERVVQFDESVLMCEDVITTMGSLVKATKAVELVGGWPWTWAGALVNRSDSDRSDYGLMGVVALIHRPMPMWPANECLACKAGSRPIANAKDNWAELTN